MADKSRIIPFIALMVAAGILFVSGRLLHIQFLYIAIAVFAILVFAAVGLNGGREKSRSATGRRFGAVMKVGLIFLAATAFGLVQSIQSGLRWLDLIYLGPAFLGSYLVWYAIKLKHAEAPSAGEMSDSPR
jgi:hypothetical protein